MRNTPLDNDPRKLRPMPPRRNYPQSQGYQDNRDPDSFSSVQLATILTKLEEGLVSHAKQIDSQAQVVTEQGRNISQLILAMGSINDALSTVKTSLERIDHGQSASAMVHETENTTIRNDITSSKTELAAHELRIVALETTQKTSSNRLFDIGKSSIGWIFAGGTLLFYLIQFFLNHYKP